MKKISVLLSVPLVLTCHASFAAVVTFDDLGLAADSFFHPGPGLNLPANTGANFQFTSGGATFTYSYTQYGDFGDGPCCWGNFTSSSRSTENFVASGSNPNPNPDSSVPPGGVPNQFRAITGDGAGAGQDAYGISTSSGSSVDFGGAVQLGNSQFTNTNYSFYSMRNGDLFNQAFDSNDFFNVVVTGLDNTGSSTNTSVEVALATGTNLVGEWLTADLSSLGTVYGLAFSYNSSSGGAPLYFAIDNIQYQAVPLPAAGWLFACSLFCFAASQRKKSAIAK